MNRFPTLRQSYDTMREHYADKTIERSKELGLAYESVMTCVYKRLLSENKRKSRRKHDNQVVQPR